MGYFFDENYYLTSRLAQLRNTGEKEREGREHTLESLYQELLQSGMTAMAHYEQQGRKEGLNPNRYFNENEYLAAKLKQMQSIGETDAQGRPYTLDSLREALEHSGMLPVEFYELFGSYETDASGYFVNPSNAFDVNAYFQARLLQVWLGNESVGGKTGTDVAMADLLAAMARSCQSPVTHYLKYGMQDVEASGIALVQSVPVSQRVSEDPWRQSTGESVPPNTGPPTPAPETVISPQAPSTAEGRAPASERVLSLPSFSLNSLLLSLDAGFKLNASFSGTGEGLVVAARPEPSGEPLPGHEARPANEADAAEHGNPSASLPLRNEVGPSPHENNPPPSTIPVGKAEKAEVIPLSAGSHAPAYAAAQAETMAFSALEASGAAVSGGISCTLSGGAVILSGVADNTFLRVDASGQVLGPFGSALLSAGGLFDASGITGAGVLAMDFQDFTAEYAVKGSLTAKNAFALGKSVVFVQGGANDDTFTVHAEHAKPDAAFALGGSGHDGDVLELAANASGNVTIGAVSGHDGDDLLFIKGAGEGAKLLVESVDLGAGLNTLILEHASLKSSFVGSEGENAVLLNAGGEIQHISFTDPQGADTVQVNSDGMAVDVCTGGGNDVVRLLGNGRIEHVALGPGDDLISVSTGSSWSSLDGGQGSDTLRVEGTGTVFLEDVRNIDVLELAGDEEQTVVLADAVQMGENGLPTIRFGQEDDTVVLSGAALTNLAVIESEKEGQGIFSLTDSESVFLRGSSFSSGGIAELRFKGRQNAVVDAGALGKIARITGEEGENTLTILEGAAAGRTVDLSFTSISEVSSLFFQSDIHDLIIGRGSLSGQAALFGLNAAGDRVTIQGIDGSAAVAKEAVDGSENQKWHLNEDSTELTYWDDSLGNGGAQVTLVRDAAAVAAVGVDSLVWECVWGE